MKVSTANQEKSNSVVKQITTMEPDSEFLQLIPNGDMYTTMVLCQTDGE